MRKNRFFALAFGVLLAVAFIAQPANAQTNQNQDNDDQSGGTHGFFFGAGMSNGFFTSGFLNVYSDFELLKLSPLKIGAYYEIPLGIGNFFAGLEGGYASGSSFGGLGGVNLLPINANATFAFNIADILYIGPGLKLGIMGLFGHEKYHILPLLGAGIDLELRYKYFPLSIYATGGVNAYPTTYNFNVLPTVEVGLRFPRGAFGRGETKEDESAAPVTSGTQGGALTDSQAATPVPPVVVTPPAPTVTSLTVTPAAVTVNQGATQQFTATVTGTNNPPQTVTWTVTGGTTGTSISPTGLLTIGPNQNPGALTVTATSTADTSRSGTAIVTVPAATTQLVPETPPPVVPPVVVPPPVAAPTVTSVTVNPAAATVNQGATQQFTATVTGTNNPPQTVTWAVTGAAAGTSISPTGLLTVGPNQAPGAFTVTATSTADTSRSGTAAVTVPAPAPTAQLVPETPPPVIPPVVTPPVAPTSTIIGIIVNPVATVVPQGFEQQFSASVRGTNDPPQTVTWSVTGATAGTSINQDGRLTVGVDQVPGDLTVTATSTADTSISGTSTVIVLDPNFEIPPTVTSILVNPVASVVPQGFEQQFSATVRGTNDPPQTVTWEVTGGTAGTSINENGLLSVAANQVPGDLTVTATSTVDTYMTGTSAVIVPDLSLGLPPAITSIIVNPPASVVPQGSTQQFTAIVNGPDNPPQTVTWEVTDAAAGTSINDNGLLAVGANQALGDLTVTATSTADTYMSGAAAVTVTAAPPPPPSSSPSQPPAVVAPPPPAAVVPPPPPAPAPIPQRRDITDTSKHSLFAEVHFEPDTAILIESTRPQLEAAGRYLQANPNLWILVRTYTAPFGTAEGRFMVALDRARFCRDFLIRNYGISPSRILAETLASERLPENVVIEEWITYRTAELIMIAE